jgi:O-antigen/teichoic acid export membrane protein
MALVGVLLILAAFSAFYYSVVNAWRDMGKAALAIVIAVVLLGAGYGALHLAGVEGF